MLKEYKDASGYIAMWHRTIPISVLDTTILEPGIGSIDTWYLVSPSTSCLHSPWLACGSLVLVLVCGNLVRINLNRRTHRATDARTHTKASLDVGVAHDEKLRRGKIVANHMLARKKTNAANLTR